MVSFEFPAPWTIEVLGLHVCVHSTLCGLSSPRSLEVTAEETVKLQRDCCETQSLIGVAEPRLAQPSLQLPPAKLRGQQRGSGRPHMTPSWGHSRKFQHNKP
ncbi:hypothetical protein RRG08_008910 [Elysia crispata]|uniref:Uncharacterized protein n=1 Tax=Elysia crispata TaxID=231223 RepID=A0AAE0ZXE2_9GAST|nr:hypothetical protein RRG08_008910 [Elysia crispata]